MRLRTRWRNILTINSIDPAQERIEQGLLGAALREPQHWLHLTGSGITAEDWVSARPIFEWVMSYRERYKVLPELQLVASQFAGWAPPPGEYAYWHDAMRKATITRRVTATMLESIDRMRDNPEETLQTLLQSLSSIRLTSSTHAVSWDSSLQGRYERFRTRGEMFNSAPDSVAGLRTSWKLINETRLGWLPGELIGLYARPTVGKSWLLGNEAVECWSNGGRVLFVSPEMPASQVNMRFDSLMAGKLGIKPWSHKQLMAGNPAMDASYIQLVEACSRSDRWWTVDSEERGEKLTLTDIANLIDRHQPDMCFIDGISLLGGFERRAEWERMKDLSYGLKSIATVRSVPIMMTHQAARPEHPSGSGRKSKDAPESDGAIGRGDSIEMPTLNKAAFGDAFVQACNTIIVAAPDPYRSDVRWYSIRKIRDREIENLQPRYAIWFDVDRGHIVDLAGMNTGSIQALADTIEAVKNVA